MAIFKSPINFRTEKENKTFKAGEEFEMTIKRAEEVQADIQRLYKINAEFERLDPKQPDDAEKKAD